MGMTRSDYRVMGREIYDDLYVTNSFNATGNDNVCE
jgi:hypothetical protein